MKYNPDIHTRQSIRLKNYDYSSSGGYFLTICAFQKQHLFGEIINSEMQLSEAGKIIAEEWYRSAEIRKELILDAFVIMPNHIHGIVFIQPNQSTIRPENADIVGANGRLPLRTQNNDSNWRMKPKSLNSFGAGFKSACTKCINELQKTPRQPVWQHGFYEHIIRNEDDLNSIRDYIQYNPKNWSEDKENVSTIKRVA